MMSRPRLQALVERSWPLPALLVWGLAWAITWVLHSMGSPVWLALTLACGAGLVASLVGRTPWRKGLIGLGFPVSVIALGADVLPAWAWLLPLAVLVLLYPVHAWRDAPLFPTPAGALLGLPACIPLQKGARILDAGCGTGQGLRALRTAYPQAQLHGLEWSWPLRWWCAVSCPWARVRQGDIWRESWLEWDVVYLFQRPESMPRAAAKARAELRPGAWLVSLEFEASALQADTCLAAPDGRPIWLYRAPLREISHHSSSNG